MTAQCAFFYFGLKKGFSYYLFQVTGVKYLNLNNYCWAIWEERFVSVDLGVFSISIIVESVVAEVRSLDLLRSSRRASLIYSVVLLFYYALLFTIL